MIKRHIISSLLEALSDTPVVLLTGARQTGKSTLVKAIASDYHPARYITLDNISMLAAVRQDPAGILAGRMEILNLWPFSQGERLGIQERFVDALFEEKLPTPKAPAEDQSRILDKVITGGYPEAVKRTAAGRRRAWFCRGLADESRRRSGPRTGSIA